MNNLNNTTNGVNMSLVKCVNMYNKIEAYFEKKYGKNDIDDSIRLTEYLRLLMEIGNTVAYMYSNESISTDINKVISMIQDESKNSIYMMILDTEDEFRNGNIDVNDYFTFYKIRENIYKEAIKRVLDL